MRRVGFVGLGMMGEPMAANLLDAGFELTVYDLRPEAVAALESRGAAVAKGLGDLARCEAAIVMVNTDPQARQVIGELIEVSEHRPCVILCMSTILPSTIRELGERANASGIGLLDAPVSGGPVGAKTGGLAIMVGGEAALLGRVRPLLEAMGRSITHVGTLGTGLAAKLVNNMITIHTIPIVAAALRLGLEQGLELSTMIPIIQQSTGNTWLTDQWEQTRMLLPFLLRDPGQLESLLGTGKKDLELAAALCEECGLDTAGVRHAIRGLEQQDAEALRSTIGKLVEALERG